MPRIFYSQQFLPQEPGYLHCSLADKNSDKQCMAPCARGGRCRRLRHQGNFCKQHWLEFRDTEKKDDIWEHVTEAFADASSEWDEKQLKMACELSLQDNVEMETEFSPVGWEAEGWNGWMSHMMATVCLSACAFRQALLWNTANFVRRLWPICADSDLSSSRGLTPIRNHMMPTWPRCLENLPTVTICACKQQPI